jgi:hypothetical protein
MWLTVAPDLIKKSYLDRVQNLMREGVETSIYSDGMSQLFTQAAGCNLPIKSDIKVGSCTMSANFNLGVIPPIAIFWRPFS